MCTHRHRGTSTDRQTHIQSQCFFTAGLDGRVAVVDANTEVLHWYASVGAEILCLAKLGPLLFSGNASGLIYQMDERTNTFNRILKSHQERVMSMAQGTTEHQLISGGVANVLLN